ncbi:hypothetical protein [Pontibacter burrus]|uniref:Exo-alpha-sialidase n=1 Tax=Pontibacter burrus TaxID=2704466 RepID=A0A6B3M265_9BACT|nr:hypothetical protein [Pontibacter burrus]NEM99717.1 hypothetical protein [Pontibacter burrus]
MRITAILLLYIILLSSCDGSKWETIKGSGISDEPKSIGKVIYFENENNGVVGGYTLVEDTNSDNESGLSPKPVLFITRDGGKNWKQVPFTSDLNGSVGNTYLRGDTLICQIDSLVFLSSDGGQQNLLLTDLIGQNIIRKHFSANRYAIEQHDFSHNDKHYNIKETYQNEFAIVNVCHGDETLTDYYFVSFDKGDTWTFLQKTFGDNRARFLLEDKFLYSYNFPFGLQRLKLK